MRQAHLTALVIVGMLQTGASRAGTPAPLIVIDRWWGVDYAKADCFREGKNAGVCDQERTQSYNLFELKLKTQFAATSECSGISVTSFGYPQNQNSPPPSFASRPYWNLSINYLGDKRAQIWQMLPPKGSDLPMMQATGTPSQIARQICTIIKGSGGAVAQ